MSVCTGLTASWCPTHGDCRCPRDPHHGDFTRGMDADDCPLHNPESEHPQAPLVQGRTCAQWREEALRLAAQGLLASARIAALLGDSGPDGDDFRRHFGQ